VKRNDDARVRDLAETIRKAGLFQPTTVRPSTAKYPLISGQGCGSATRGSAGTRSRRPTRNGPATLLSAASSSATSMTQVYDDEQIDDHVQAAIERPATEAPAPVASDELDATPEEPELPVSAELAPPAPLRAPQQPLRALPGRFRRRRSRPRRARRLPAVLAAPAQ